MYAVIETGGKQYRVSEGDVVTIEKLKADTGSKVEFDKVLLIGEGNEIEVGTPYLDAARVFGSIVESGKGEKVIIFKYKSKKDYRKKQGHRQPYTMVQIDGLSKDGQAPAKKAAPKQEIASEVTESKPESEAGVAVAEEKKPAVKRPAAKKAVEENVEAEKKPAAKKPAAKKADEENSAAEKKPAAKKTTSKKSEETKTEQE